MTNDEFKELCLRNMQPGSGSPGQWATAYAMTLVVEQLVEAHQAAFEMISLMEKIARSLDPPHHMPPGGC